MKNNKILDLVCSLILPAVLAVLGITLIINPNAASALASKILGWVLLGGCVCTVVSAIVSWPAGRVGKIIGAVALFAIGGYLLRNPLALAANLGKLLGLFLLIQGIVNLADHQNKVGAAVTIIIGGYLLLSPLALSQWVFRIIGAVLLGLGVSNIIDRLKKARETEDPNIIDAL